MLTNEQLTLSLLEFALKESKIKKPHFISEDDHDELVFPHDWGGKCLVKVKGKWAVYGHDERYQVRNLAVHDDVTSACDDFFCRVTDYKGMYINIDKWERVTGLKF